MPNIVRWDPFAELDEMRHRMDRIFSDFRPTRLALDATTEMGYFPIDVAETDEAFQVKAALPGLKPEEVEVQIHGDTVTIKGESREEEEEKGKNWLRRERRYGVFARTFSLPTGIDADKATADFRDGVLVLGLPKSEASRPKTIKVKGVLEGEKP
jgi:HSP20 family protein